jgi:uncharacterized protein (DUF736 family)
MAQEDKIGALWVRKNDKGEQAISGQLELNGERLDIVVFKNTYKTEDKHPTYVIYKSRPKTAAAAVKPAAKPAAKAPQQDENLL